MQVGISKLGGYAMLAGDCSGEFSQVVLGQNNEWLTDCGRGFGCRCTLVLVAGPLDPHGLGPPTSALVGRDYPGVFLVTKLFRPIFVADTQTISRRRPR